MKNVFKRSTAVLCAGIISIAAISALPVSAQEKGSRVFDTYNINYSAVGTINLTMNSDADNEIYKIQLENVFDHSGWTEDGKYRDVKVTRLKMGNTTYTDEEDIELYVDVSKNTAADNIVVDTNVDAGKNVSVTVEVYSPKFTKSDTPKAIKKADHEAKIPEADITGTLGTNIKGNGGKASVTIKTDKRYLQIAGTATNGTVDGDAWSTLSGSTKGNNIAADADLSAKMPGLDTEVANTIAANRDAKITFYFKDMKKNEEEFEEAPDYGQDTEWNLGEIKDFAIRINGTKALAGNGVINDKDLSITFDWDDVLEKSNLVNAVGQVRTIEFKANTDGFLYDEEYDDDTDEASFRYEIVKIKVEWPENDTVAEDLSNLAAGESCIFEETVLA